MFKVRLFMDHYDSTGVVTALYVDILLPIAPTKGLEIDLYTDNECDHVILSGYMYCRPGCDFIIAGTCQGTLDYPDALCILRQGGTADVAASFLPIGKRIEFDD